MVVSSFQPNHLRQLPGHRSQATDWGLQYLSRGQDIQDIQSLWLRRKGNLQNMYYSLYFPLIRRFGEEIRSQIITDY